MSNINLEMQVAMLRNALQDAVEEYKKLPHSLGYTITHGQRWERMIANTQATAEAYEREHTAKEKQELITWLYECGYLTKAAEELYEAQLRAANKKGGE